MSEYKKQIRKQFRDEVFTRDHYTCQLCLINYNESKLDAHHIINRNYLPHQGYHKDNGITLCKKCHYEIEKSYGTNKEKEIQRWCFDQIKMTQSIEDIAEELTKKIKKVFE